MQEHVSIIKKLTYVQKIPQPTIGCHVSFAKPHYLVGAVREALSYGS
ncbi:hypothetical protein [Mycoplasma sp. ATU-Cv-508]